MKILAVSALLCAMMALTTAVAVPLTKPEDEQAALVDYQGWLWNGPKNFFYVPDKLTWAEAERNCICLGGHLASVHSCSEYNQIRGLVKPKGELQAWIGGTDQQREGVWRWSDGSNFSYTFWCSGEPNNGGGSNQDCLQMSFGDYKRWDDLQCDGRLPSICARNKYIRVRH